MKRSRRFSAFADRARAIRRRYDELAKREGRAEWGSADFLQGFVGDVGTLAKLVMAKNGRRAGAAKDLDARLGHELADCLWSVIVLADELGVDLEPAFFATMDELEARFPKPRGQSARVRRTRAK